MPKIIPTEVKERAIALVVEATTNGEPVAAACRRVGEELGLSPNSLRAWVRKHRQEQDPAAQRRMELEEEIRRLKAELAAVNKQNEIIRKAFTFFAEESEKPSR